MAVWFFCLLFPISVLAKEIVTIYAVDRHSGRVVIDEQSELGMTPASCMKVLTTGAALHLLGEESCFTTTMEYDGEIKEGLLHGNLYVRGGGDPCLGAKDWEGQLQIWGKAITDLGIKQVMGRVVCDASAWESALAAPGWSWEDLGNYYGAGASALSFHENCYTLTLKPSDEGAPAAICSTTPPQYDLDYHNELVTGPKGSGDQASIFGSEFSAVRFLRGSIPAGVEQFSIKGTIPNPPAYLEQLLTKTMEKIGVVVRGDSLAERARIPFHTTRSPSIAKIVHEVNRHSMNLYAEHLLKAMGGGSTVSGARVVKEFWQREGVDLTDAQISDGSGLSRTNVLNARQCVEVLQRLEKSSHFASFYQSLPEEAGMKVKSGSMSLVKGYIGYSDQLVFAFFVGQCPDGEKKKAAVEQCFAKLRTVSIQSCPAPQGGAGHP